MKYQVREHEVMADAPKSKLYDTYEEALEELKRQRANREYPESEYFYLYIHTNYLAK